MSDTTEFLNRKMSNASDLKTVVRTMKSLAASNIGQYEKSVHALVDYYRTVELGIGSCFLKGLDFIDDGRDLQKKEWISIAIIFGSDQGLVGQFNETLANYIVNTTGVVAGKTKLIVIGERIYGLLQDAGLSPSELLALPRSVEAIEPLMIEIQLKSDQLRISGNYEQVFVFHNKPMVEGALYAPVSLALLPLNKSWQINIKEAQWPNKMIPDVMNGAVATLPALIREYLFISLFRACAESLMSENTSRLAAMQRAEDNIDELLQSLQQRLHYIRQSKIDEELFDVISGFEMLSQSDLHEKSKLFHKI